MCKEERDFTYLIPQLKDSNIDATYESFQLMPECQLGERIVQRLFSVGFDGWLYILTHQCFTRRTYTDELSGAIDQALLRMGPYFPMAGLMYGISAQHVPPVLRVLPCISLNDPDWKAQIFEVLRSDLSHSKKGMPRKETHFAWKLHSGFNGDPSKTVIEVRPRNERIQYWRFAIPRTFRAIKWGQGPAGVCEITNVRFAEASGLGRHENRDVTWFGAANTVSNTESAYAVFSGPLPDFICFGPAESPFGPPGHMEILYPHLLAKSGAKQNSPKVLAS
jgi:hypothetical protein